MEPDEKVKENATLPPCGDLGLRPPEGRNEWYGVLKYLGEPEYVEEGRETFWALVPDRFKPKPHAK